MADLAPASARSDGSSSMRSPALLPRGSARLYFVGSDVPTQSPRGNPPAAPPPSSAASSLTLGARVAQGSSLGYRVQVDISEHERMASLRGGGGGSFPSLRASPASETTSTPPPPLPSHTAFTAELELSPPPPAPRFKSSGGGYVHSPGRASTPPPSRLQVDAYIEQFKSSSRAHPPSRSTSTGRGRGSPSSSGFKFMHGDPLPGGSSYRLPGSSSLMKRATSRIPVRVENLNPYDDTRAAAAVTVPPPPLDLSRFKSACDRWSPEYLCALLSSEGTVQVVDVMDRVVTSTMTDDLNALRTAVSSALLELEVVPSVPSRDTVQVVLDDVASAAAASSSHARIQVAALERLEESLIVDFNRETARLRGEATSTAGELALEAAALHQRVLDLKRVAHTLLTACGDSGALLPQLTRVASLLKSHVRAWEEAVAQVEVDEAAAVDRGSHLESALAAAREQALREAEESGAKRLADVKADAAAALDAARVAGEERLRSFTLQVDASQHEHVHESMRGMTARIKEASAAAAALQARVAVVDAEREAVTSLLEFKSSVRRLWARMDADSINAACGVSQHSLVEGGAAAHTPRGSSEEAGSSAGGGRSLVMRVTDALSDGRARRGSPSRASVTAIARLCVNAFLSTCLRSVEYDPHFACVLTLAVKVGKRLKAFTDSATPVPTQLQLRSVIARILEAAKEKRAATAAAAAMGGGQAAALADAQNAPAQVLARAGVTVERNSMPAYIAKALGLTPPTPVAAHAPGGVSMDGLAYDEVMHYITRPPAAVTSLPTSVEGSAEVPTSAGPGGSAAAPDKPAPPPPPPLHVRAADAPSSPATEMATDSKSVADAAAQTTPLPTSAGVYQVLSVPADYVKQVYDPPAAPEAVSVVPVPAVAPEVAPLPGPLDKSMWSDARPSTAASTASTSSSLHVHDLERDVDVYARALRAAETAAAGQGNAFTYIHSASSAPASSVSSAASSPLLPTPHEWSSITAARSASLCEPPDPAPRFLLARSASVSGASGTQGVTYTTPLTALAHDDEHYRVETVTAPIGDVLPTTVSPAPAAALQIAAAHVPEAQTEVEVRVTVAAAPSAAAAAPVALAPIPELPTEAAEEQAPAASPPVVVAPPVVVEAVPQTASPASAPVAEEEPVAVAPAVLPAVEPSAAAAPVTVNEAVVPAAAAPAAEAASAASAPAPVASSAPSPAPTPTSRLRSTPTATATPAAGATATAAAPSPRPAWARRDTAAIPASSPAPAPASGGVKTWGRNLKKVEAAAPAPAPVAEPTVATSEPVPVPVAAAPAPEPVAPSPAPAAASETPAAPEPAADASEAAPVVAAAPEASPAPAPAPAPASTGGAKAVWAQRAATASASKTTSVSTTAASTTASVPSWKARNAAAKTAAPPAPAAGEAGEQSAVPAAAAAAAASGAPSGLVARLAAKVSKG